MLKSRPVEAVTIETVCHVLIGFRVLVDIKDQIVIRDINIDQRPLFILIVDIK